MSDLKIHDQPAYLQQLNEVQRQAVTTTEGPVLVVAGPGSGKTRVLTFRIAHLIQQGVPPWEILALTFTNKAAREMKERIERVVGERASRVWAGTFHSIFARILRIEADKIGYPSDFTIYDTDDTKSVLGAIITEMGLNKDQYNVNFLRNRISSAKSNLITPKLYRTRKDLLDEDHMAQRPRTVEVYEKYMARCKRSGAMDFDDLLLRMFELLQNHPDVCDKYRQRFRYLLVDEFQDTNFLQYAIVRKLVHYPGSPCNICVVGDDAQSIYGFRGATIRNILEFESDFKNFGIKVFKLEANYRSTEHIVQAANELIAHNTRQIPKTIYSQKGPGERIKLIRAMTDSEEGRRVADTILELKNRHHLRNSDFAILYRTNAQSRIFEEHLRHYNIPYRVFGGMSFYQRKEIKDLIAYLRLAVNPRDDEALRRIINYPRRGIGNTTLDKLGNLASQLDLTMWEALPRLDAGTRTNTLLQEFRHLIESFQQKAAQTDAYTAASYIAQHSGLLKELGADKTPEGLQRFENVTGLLDGIKAFVENDVLETGQEASTDRSLAAYLQNIALVTDLDQADDDGDYVTLMSVHSAKGLEFKSVFVTGLEEQLFPSYLSLDSPEAIDEERRLLYVAITRAEQFLTLSFAHSRYRYGQQRMCEPSRFLSEIAPEHLDQTSPHGSLSRAPFGRFENRMGPRSTQTQSAPPRSGVSGNFKKPRQQTLRADPATFKPSPPEAIQPGMKVLHLQFGEGKVLKVDGARDKRVATVFFPDLDTDQEKRIMLKFAKMQIIS